MVATVAGGRVRSFVIHCPHLNRDVRGILNAVPNVRIWTGYPTERGEDGCLQAHQGIVALAKQHSWPRVFVMEDDCQFTKHFDYERWEEDARWSAVNGYDVLVGGCVQTYGPKIVRDGLVRVDKFHSAHCIVYNASGYDKILQTIQPFDTSIGDQGAKTVMTYPFVAVQRPVYSGILKKDVNYVPLYEQYEGHLGRALGLR